MRLSKTLSKTIEITVESIKAPDDKSYQITVWKAERELSEEELATKDHFFNDNGSVCISVSELFKVKVFYDGNEDYSSERTFILEKNATKYAKNEFKYFEDSF